MLKFFLSVGNMRMMNKLQHIYGFKTICYMCICYVYMYYVKVYPLNTSKSHSVCFFQFTRSLSEIHKIHNLLTDTLEVMAVNVHIYIREHVTYN